MKSQFPKFHLGEITHFSKLSDITRIGSIFRAVFRHCEFSARVRHAYRGASRPYGRNGVTVARRGSHRMKEPCRLRSSVKHVKTARKWAVTGVENGPLLYYPVILVAKTVKTVIIIYIQTVCNCENGRTGGRVGGSHSRGRARSLFFR